MKDKKRMLKLMYQRKLNNLTQAELAEKVGVSKSAIVQYECGKREPDIEKLKKFAEVLNCKIDDLV